MTPDEMLYEAHQVLQKRTVNTATNYAYFEGRHSSQLNTESWNKAFRARVMGAIDNQCAVVIRHRAGAIRASGVEVVEQTGFDLTAAEILAEKTTEIFTECSNDLGEAVEHAEISAEPTAVLTDFDEDGNVKEYDLHPCSSYVRLSNSGKPLWLVWYWEDTDGTTSVTIITPEYKIVGRSNTTATLPGPTVFRWQEPLPNVFNRVLVSVVDKRVSVLKGVIPLNDILNKSLQTQLVVGESFAMPLRYLLGIDTYNPETGEQGALPANMNPGTGSRDIAIASAADADGNPRQIIQTPSPEPSKYIAEQDSVRAAIAVQGEVPSMVTMLMGTQPASGEALEINYMPHIERQRQDIDNYYRQFFTQIAHNTAMALHYAFTGQIVEPPKLKVNFVSVSPATTQSRVSQMAEAVAAGITLADALVEFMGMSRISAEAIQANAVLAANESTAASNAYGSNFRL